MFEAFIVRDSPRRQRFSEITVFFYARRKFSCWGPQRDPDHDRVNTNIAVSRKCKLSTAPGESATRLHPSSSWGTSRGSATSAELADDCRISHATIGNGGGRGRRRSVEKACFSKMLFITLIAKHEPQKWDN